MAGFQLLDLHDFPGQGTALVGVLDPFWEEKGYITPGEYSRFCNETVPLARLQHRIFSNDQTFEAEVEAAHFGSEALSDPDIRWKISSAEGGPVAEGSFDKAELALGNAHSLGIIRLELGQFTKAEKLNLEVSVNQYSNDWDFWVYPSALPDLDEGDILVTGVLDRAAKKVLQGGGKVLWTLAPNSLSDSSGGDIALGFSSIFWNTAWTNGQAPHTLGILCDPDHAALAEFPTEHHSNWQWWDAMHHGQVIRMDGFRSKIEPVVRIIDDWFENRPLGLIFEARVGEGKLLISGADLLSDKENRPEAKQLLYSLKKYMGSSRFQPSKEITNAELDQLIKQANRTK
jgi:hypothetical protein